MSCSCGWPERLPDGPYQGEVIQVLKGGHELRRLTEHERRHSGDDRFCIVGLSHWNPPDFFARYASQLRASAAVHEAAGALLERLPSD